MNRCLPDMTIIADSDYEAQISAIGEFDDIQSYLDLLSADSWFTRAVADVAELWWLILICISASFVVGLLWMFVVRFFVGMITWIMLVVCFFALLGITLYTWVSSDSLDADSGNVVYEYIDSENLRTVLRVLACVLLGITILYFFLIVFIRKRIKLAIAVIKEASLSLGLTPCLSFFPIFQAFFYVAFIMYWVVVLLFLASAHSNSETIDDIEVMGYKPVVTVMYLGIYHLFGGLWVIYWLSGVGITTVAGAIADRYWSAGGDRKVLSTSSSLWRTLRYSSGSIAMGSFLVATMSFIRIIFEYFSRLKAKAAKKNIKWLKYLLKLVSCCLWCFEKIIKWISESAYIMIAIAGKSFFTSAVHAVSLKAANFLRVLVLQGIAFFTLNITRIAIATICSLVASIVCYNYSDLSDVLDQVYQTSTLNYWYVPVAMVFVGSFFVSGVFTNVFSTSIDTVMMSFCEDESMNGSVVNKKFAHLMKSDKRDAVESEDEVEMKKRRRKERNERLAKDGGKKHNHHSSKVKKSKNSSRQNIVSN
jgi:hypothetical protein